MYVQIELSFGGWTWARVVDWGLDVDSQEDEWLTKRAPFLVVNGQGYFQRGSDGYYFPI